MSTNLDKYDIIDTFDDNQFQTVLMGIDTLTMVDIVIINKLKSSIELDDEFFRLYQNICDNLIFLERNEAETIIVNQYKQSQLLNDYLQEEDLSFESRVLLAKSFLLQAVNYQDFSNPIKIILINEDQLTVRNNQLHFSNYLFLKKYHKQVSNGDVLKSMGKTLETILQLYKEPLTGETKPYQKLIYKLMNSDLDYDIRQLYQKFDAVTKGHEEVEVIQENINVEEIVSLSKDDIKLVEDKDEATDLEETPIEVITLEEETIDTSQEASKANSPDKTEEDIPIPAFDDDFKEEILESNEEVIVQEDFLDEISEAKVQSYEPEDITEEISHDAAKVSETEKIIEEISHDEVVLSEPEEIIEGISHDVAKVSEHEEIIEEISHDEFVLSETEEISHEAAKVSEPEEMSQLVNDTLDPPLLKDEPIDQFEAVEPIKNESHASKENKHHRIVLENNTKGDSIQEILDRNDRLHSTFSEESKKKRYFPTFLLFFIVLTIITVLLILYSSTYA